MGFSKLQPNIFFQIGIALLTAILAACQPAAAAMQKTTPEQETPVSVSLSATPILPPTPTDRLAPSRRTSPTPKTPTLWLPSYLPEHLTKILIQKGGILPAQQENEANLILDIVEAGDSKNLGKIPWVYVLAAPFPTVTDEASLADVQIAWTEGKSSGLPIQSLLVASSTAEVFEKKWGRASGLVKILPAEELLAATWSLGNAWAILPFEDLEPRWKVILVDGQSPVRKNFRSTTYGLTVYFGLTGDPLLADLALSEMPSGNWSSDRMTTVLLTGVTALVRGTASLMEVLGMTYPASDIGNWLREADILHISNEVPFAVNCPQPFNWEGLAFCSQEEYIQLLEDVGTDVVELTGDHFKDWGPEAMLFTLKLYNQRGWKYYGGGANAEEAAQPALFEHNGNRIAFTGCNAKEEGYSSASETTPGAIHCDFDQITQTVRDLVENEYQPIVTFQHLEYYSYKAHPILQKDFHRMVEAGAVIVQGSQAHQPHSFEFLSGSTLHYGLGNLFFDQTNQGEPPRTAFIDRHVFYEGRHISTELLTIYFVDYARARPMTIEERQVLLKTVFQSSLWDLDIPVK